jgi:DNA-binding response OmpR family regulator
MARHSVLIVDDDDKINRLLRAYFENSGFEVLAAFNGQDALKLFAENKPDAVILDLMMPDPDGWEVCRRIRLTSDVPILMLTARGAEAEKVLGLDSGADDYVTKPFSFREVVARVKVIIRRANKAQVCEACRTVRELSIDSEMHRVTCRGQVINLTATEFKILALLAAHPDKPFSRRNIAAHIQGEGVLLEACERTIDAHIKNLRRKIEADPSNPGYILTEYGIGYKLAGDADD